MLLEFILGQLDGELARWQQLRAIVAGLQTPTIPTAPSPQAAPVPIVAPTVTSSPAPIPTPECEHSTSIPGPAPVRRRVRVFKSPQPTSRTPEPRALSGVIPAGPVVVSAAALKEREAERQRTSLLPASPPLDPEVLLRELSQRWGTGGAHA